MSQFRSVTGAITHEEKVVLAPTHYFLFHFLSLHSPMTNDEVLNLYLFASQINDLFSLEFAHQQT